MEIEVNNNEVKESCFRFQVEAPQGLCVRSHHPHATSQPLDTQASKFQVRGLI